MKSFVFYIIYIMLLFTCYSCSLLAEEIELLSIPENDNTEIEYPYSFTVTDVAKKSASALFHITNTVTKKSRSITVSGIKEINLPSGTYSVYVDGGLRHHQGNFTISVPEEGISSHEVILKPYAPIEPAGWIMVDTFYNNSSAISRSSLSELAAALELRTIFTPTNSILNQPEEFTTAHQVTDSLLSSITPFVHKDLGSIISFNCFKTEPTPRIPTPLTSALYPLLASLHDSNNLIAMSPTTYYFSHNETLSKPSEEFIFDTICGPLYDLLLLDDFDSSVKIWHTLLNLGYRISAIYSGGNNFCEQNFQPSTKLYVKIPRKNYSLKMLHTAIKSGHSVISNGPFIRFFVESLNAEDDTHKTGLDNDKWINGHSLKIGGVGFVSKNTRNIYAEAYTCSSPNDEINRIELIYNGRVVNQLVAEKAQKTLNARWKIKLDKPGWVQLRYISKNGNFNAITNPIYLVDHKSTTPSPALARTQILVVDADTNKPIKSKILVENFGTTINSAEVFEHAIILQTPATSSIVVESPGYKTHKMSIYSDGGGAKYIRSLYTKKVLNKALMKPVTYGYLKKALLNSKLLFKLEKK